MGVERRMGQNMLKPGGHPEWLLCRASSQAVVAGEKGGGNAQLSESQGHKVRTGTQAQVSIV